VRLRLLVSYLIQFGVNATVLNQIPQKFGVFELTPNFSTFLFKQFGKQMLKMGRFSGEKRVLRGLLSEWRGVLPILYNARLVVHVCK
jgi:hypothetical protein